MKDRRYFLILIVLFVFACEMPSLTSRDIPIPAPTAIVTPTNADAVTTPTNPIDINTNIIWLTFLEIINPGFGVKITLGKDGNIYVAKTIGVGDETALLMEFDQNGEIKWETSFAKWEYGNYDDLEVDSKGNILLSGDSTTAWGNPINPYLENASTFNAFLAKFDKNGSLLWNTFISDNSGGASISTDKEDNIYAVFVEFDNGISSGLSLVKFNSNGVQEWRKSYTSLVDATPLDLSVDSNGNILIGGSRGLGTGDFDCFASKFANNGDLLWNVYVGIPESADSCDSTMDVDANGNIYMAGVSTKSWGNPINPFVIHDRARDYNFFAAKLDGNGRVVWNTFIDDFAHINDLSLDATGSFLYLVGSGESLINDESRKDGLIAQMDTDGRLLSKKIIGDEGFDEIMYLAVGDDQRIYIIGDSSVTFGNPIHPITSELSFTNLDTYLASISMKDDEQNAESESLAPENNPPGNFLEQLTSGNVLRIILAALCCVGFALLAILAIVLTSRFFHPGTRKQP